MAFVALAALAQNVGDGQSAGRDRGRDRADERQQWFLSGRTPRGEGAASRLFRAYQQRVEARTAAQSAGNSPADASAAVAFPSLQWSSLGPRPIDSDPTQFQSYGLVSGRVTSIAVDQKDSSGNTVFIGTANGGVWKSTNAAAADPNTVSWQPLTDKMPSLAIGAVAIQPGANANVILAGTGEANSSATSYYGMGILRSADGGSTWTTISAANSGARQFRGLGFSRIAFHTGNPSVVVAAAGSTNGVNKGGDDQGEAGRGIYFSLDAGESWTFADMRTGGVLIQPSSVTDVVFNAMHNKFYAAVRGQGFFESANGQFWSRMAQQPGAGLALSNCPATASSSCPLLRARLAVRPDTGEVFTAWIDAAEVLSIYRLPSNGAAWQAMGKQGIDDCGDAGNVGCGAQQGSYNLALDAIPNGSNTDLYFGAVNLFKCGAGILDQLCSAPSAWKNLTHAYGCTPLGAPAHVHPGQHGAGYPVGSPGRIFFVNDGGVYRAMSAFTLNSGSCNVANAFDNLNTALGPLGQFNSLAQASSDPSLFLGGVQANGSLVFHAADAGSSGLTWRAANLGEGGHAAIDPNDGNILYTSFPAGESVTIQRCSVGSACRQNTWNTVADSSTLGGDGSAFIAPYILDSQDHGRLLAGTCRVWRGPATGGSFTALSGILAGNASLNCSGGTSTGETKIRSLATGGPAGTSGAAKVIYAGMVGRAGGASGRVFITTDADSGPASWADRTGGINPSGYDIGDIAVSPFDDSGKTAYVAIMGFGVSHIFKTTNAGLDWSDRTGNLPDVPVNSLAIDPANNALLFAGTDVGVYVSADDGGTWAELGTGLPNVPVAKLLTFVSGNIRKLRAATIGRGVWQIDLPVVAVKATPSALNLGTSVVGRSTPAQSVLLANDSAGSITLTGVFTTGPYRATHDCPSTLPVGSFCTLTVELVPASGGPQPGMLTMNHTAGSITVPLAGAGVDFALSLNRPSRPSRSGGGANVVMSHGQTISLELILQAAGLLETPVPVSLTCESPAPDLVCEVQPAEVQIGTRERTTARMVISLAARAVRARRLARVKPALSNSYIVSVRASSGASSKVMQLRVQTQ